jgi:hypothetical protein
MTALTLILPCFNEAERLPATLATYLAQLPTAPAATEVLVRAQACSGSRVRLLADGRRMLGEVWSVRRELGPGHPTGERAYVQ